MKRPILAFAWVAVMLLGVGCDTFRSNSSFWNLSTAPVRVSASFANADALEYEQPPESFSNFTPRSRKAAVPLLASIEVKMTNSVTSYSLSPMEMSKLRAAGAGTARIVYFDSGLAALPVNAYAFLAKASTQDEAFRYIRQHESEFLGYTARILNE